MLLQCFHRFTFSIFFLLRIIIYESKTIIFSFKREIIITSLFKKHKLTSRNNFKISRHQRNFWLVRNVQKYYISMIPYLSSSKKFYPMLHLKRYDAPTLSPIRQSMAQLFLSFNYANIHAISPMIYYF